MKELLYSQINEIKDVAIKEFIREALDNAPEEFWHSPCSGSGKYHPPENQGDEGVVRHLYKCGKIALELCRFFGLENPYDKDVVFAGAILHDIKKNGEPWEPSTSLEHAIVGADYLKQFDLYEPAKTDITNCVRYHMGRWSSPESELERACNPTKRELIVQLSDFFGSRKIASHLPGIEINDEDIQTFYSKFAESLNSPK